MDTENKYVSKPIPNDTVILKEEQDKLKIDFAVTSMNALEEGMPEHRADQSMSDTISRMPTPEQTACVFISETRSRAPMVANGTKMCEGDTKGKALRGTKIPSNDVVNNVIVRKGTKKNRQFEGKEGTEIKRRLTK